MKFKEYIQEAKPKGSLQKALDKITELQKKFQKDKHRWVDAVFDAEGEAEALGATPADIMLAKMKAR